MGRPKYMPAGAFRWGKRWFHGYVFLYLVLDSMRDARGNLNMMLENLRGEWKGEKKQIELRYDEYVPVSRGDTIAIVAYADLQANDTEFFYYDSLHNLTSGEDCGIGGFYDYLTKKGGMLYIAGLFRPNKPLRRFITAKSEELLSEAREYSEALLHPNLPDAVPLDFGSEIRVSADSQQLLSVMEGSILPECQMGSVRVPKPPPGKLWKITGGRIVLVDDSDERDRDDAKHPHAESALPTNKHELAIPPDAKDFVAGLEGKRFGKAFLGSLEVPEPPPGKMWTVRNGQIVLDDD